ncbi:MAG TPA: GGDEF domain-containing protein, partial [Alphaproteobacteria bacterium]|nr:GGDEF domain-containing protein [Alphaproteobacteria bacterium]
RTVTDVATILGITEGELTANVRNGLAKLIAEVERLRRDLDAKEHRIAYLERLADEDPLAPILNRRAFVRELSRMMSFAERYGVASSVVYIDVNSMKRLNDTYGHSAGDAALAHVANILLANVRGSDAVGRLGGDEFGVLLAQADQAAATAKAADLKREIEAKAVAWDGRELVVTVSVGACAFDGGGEPHEILRAADQAMYRQKRGGASP